MAEIKKESEAKSVVEQKAPQAETPAKKEEPKVKEVAAKAKTTASKAKATAKTVAKKTTSATKAKAKTAAAKTKTAATKAKTAAKKTPAVAKKAPVVPNVFIQAGNAQAELNDIIENVKNRYIAEGGKTISKVDIYLKPEDGAAYYVINGKSAGQVDLF